MTSGFTQSQVEALARQVGFAPDRAKIAAAIAMCEAPLMVNGVAYSNPDAVGDQALADAKWGYSYGMWQIRTLRADKGTGRLRDEDLLKGNPTRQAWAARQIFRQNLSFNPWSTYTGGQYKAYLQDEFPPPPGSYLVVGGDTLSGIAAKVSKGKWTWRDLADTNGIVSPYVIHIGQLLLLPFDKQGA